MEPQNKDTGGGGQFTDRLNEEISRILEFQKSGLSDARIDISRLNGNEQNIGQMVNQLIELFLTEQTAISEVLDSVSEGSFVAEIPKLPGSRIHISENLSKILGSLFLLQTDISRFSDACQAGDMTARIDSSRYLGGFREMVEMLDEGFEAQIDPFRLISTGVADFADGKIPDLVDVSKYPGEFGKILKDLNRIVEVSKIRGEDINLLISSAVEGRLDVRADPTKYPGYHGRIIEGINKMIDAYINPINVSAEYIDRISKGDIPPRITELYRGDFNEIKNNLNALIDVVHMRNEDIKMLINSGIDGRLDVRADDKKYPGENGRMIEGINNMLDAYIGPINVSAEYIDRISKGDLPPKITESYRGDFNEIKNNLNNLIDVVHLRNDDIKALIDAALDGKLDFRADSKKYPGENGKLIEGINDMLDAYIGPINVSAEYIDRISKGDIPPKITDIYKGDFNEIKNNLNTLIDVINLRNDDINLLSKAALEGRLDVRADISKYSGYHGGLIDRINKMLDSYLGPINVSAEYIDRISKGDLPPLITDVYHGDFNEIKNNLNNCITTLSHFVNSMDKMYQDQVSGNIDSYLNENEFIGVYQEMARGVNEDVKLHVNNILKILGIIVSYAQGDFSPVLEKLPGKQVIANENMDLLRSNLIQLTEDVGVLGKSAMEGRLDIRADTGKYQGDFLKIANGFNMTLDAVINPLNVSAEYIDRISKGDIPPKIIDDYRGDFNEIKNNLNALIDVVNLRNSDIQLLIKAATDGHLDVRADSLKYPGENGRMIDGINHMLDAYIGPINVSAEYIDRISKGDVPPKITDEYHGDFNEIKNNLNVLIEVIHLRNDDINQLSTAAVEGRLDFRADISKYTGYHGRLIDRINKILDSYLGPINVSAEYIDRISKGDIPPKITDEYRGDFVEIKNNLNALIDVVHMRNDDIKMLIQSAIEGKLDVRADSSKYPGENGKMIDGINHMLDAYIGPINVSAEYIDRISKGDIPPKITDDYRGDFNEIKNNLNALIDVVHMRNGDIKMLIQAAIDGKLDVRADSSKYPGENGKMLDGINHMLDSYIGPLNLAAEYIDRISKGDLPPVITDEFRGDFNEIKNNLNQCIGAIHLLIDDANLLSEAAVIGKLDIRADPHRHQGDFAKVVTGMNNTLNSVVAPLREAMRLSDLYAKCNFTEMFDDTIRADGDFALFRKSLDHIGDEISDTLIKLKSEMESLTHHASTAQFGVEDVSRGAKEISQNAEETSDNAAKAEDGIDQVLRAMSDLTLMVSEISGNADMVARLSEDANNLAMKGTEHAENADKGMASITRSSSEVESIITEIRSEMNQIRKIVSIITDLANQTNLLALNAAIEAARAGDAGRGFAVVASEVKSLAQESRSSAESITDMIQGLERKSDNAAIAIEAAGKAVKEGNLALSDTLNVFNQLTSSVDTINQKMLTIARATEQQAASFEEITASANEMSNLVKKTADDATQSSATSEEALAVVSQITDIIELINKAVANMHKEMEIFTLRRS